MKRIAPTSGSPRSVDGRVDLLSSVPGAEQVMERTRELRTSPRGPAPIRPRSGKHQSDVDGGGKRSRFRRVSVRASEPSQLSAHRQRPKGDRLSSDLLPIECEPVRVLIAVRGEPVYRVDPQPPDPPAVKHATRREWDCHSATQLFGRKAPWGAPLPMLLMPECRTIYTNTLT
jgi:hypothetical protein